MTMKMMMMMMIIIIIMTLMMTMIMMIRCESRQMSVCLAASGQSVALSAQPPLRWLPTIFPPGVITMKGGNMTLSNSQITYF